MLLPATLVANQSAGISIMCWVVSRDTWHHPAHSPHPLITQRRHSHGHHHHPNVITSSPSLSPWMGVPSVQHIWHYTGGTWYFHADSCQPNYTSKYYLLQYLFFYMSALPKTDVSSHTKNGWDYNSDNQIHMKQTVHLKKSLHYNNLGSQMEHFRLHFAVKLWCKMFPRGWNNYAAMFSIISGVWAGVRVSD